MQFVNSVAFERKLRGMAAAVEQRLECWLYEGRGLKSSNNGKGV
jgi:hypothetical protein